MTIRLHILRSFLALGTCSALVTGCSSGGPLNYTPLAVTQLNRTYVLTSASNAAHIGGFVGPIHNSPPHAQQGADYYSDGDATFTIQPDSTGNMCTEGAFTLTGKLTNETEQDVYINLSGSVGGGTMSLTGLVQGANVQNSGIIKGTYKIDGGTCQVGETAFTGTGQQ